MARKKTAMDFFVIPKTRKPGIYAIVNWEDFSCYVGSSQDIRKRAQSHKTALKAGKHVCKELQEAKDKGKILRFIVLLEFENTVSRDELILAEYCYMLSMRYKSFGLYNTQPKETEWCNKTKAIENHVISSVLSRYATDRHIEHSLEKEYGRVSAFMYNTKYREKEAKKEIGF